ncbi:DedA family protein [Pseudalkalibacillus salsuginis]|uniref:DedA family protein n=1 Tax=Pseudalkalibacillus salsuginis TaxID=2910972 RepID=UPI001F30F00B|nr:DedA family protein [Pseudalkalibacillus salsuginis]MCF6409412.1 DedA family protein [Pseudalkalibacillus salsuginis]
MNLENMTVAIENYGYWIILITLFCGVVGIPAPEETFLVLIGMLTAQHHLLLIWTVICAFMGSLSGMLTAYMAGRYLGIPFLNKYGRYLKITSEHWEKASTQFRRYGTLTILFGLFIPGVRQLAPYIAGTSRYPFPVYVAYSIIGSALWAISYIFVGFYIGDQIPIQYFPWLGVAALVLFIGAIFIKKKSLKGGSRA